MKSGGNFIKASILLLALLICGSCFADTIVLKGGQSLTGDILVEKKTQLIVDVGIEILTIPKNKIHKYEYDKTVKTELTDIIEPRQLTGQLYHTANLKKTTIEECVEEFSEAVVKVSTPAGMGAGFFLTKRDT